MAFVRTSFSTVVYLDARHESALRTAERISAELNAKQQQEDMNRLYDHLRRMDGKHICLPEWMKRESSCVRSEREFIYFPFFFEGNNYVYSTGVIDLIVEENGEIQSFKRVWPIEPEDTNEIEYFDWDEIVL